MSEFDNQVAFCQKCHRAFNPLDEGEGYTCFACMSELLDEPPKVEWEDDDLR